MKLEYPETMRRWVVMSALLCLLGGVAGGAVRATLEVADRQEDALGDYRLAKLTVTNSADSAVAAVELRASGGGPTVRYPMTVAPGSTGEQDVALPAMSPVQEYVIVAIGPEGNELGRTSAAITWPEELLAADAFVDDAFKAWADDIARWPESVRRRYLLMAALFATVAAACLLIPWPALRGAAVVGWVGVSLLLGVVFAGDSAATLQRHRYSLRLHDGRGGLSSDSFTVLRASRTMVRSVRAWPVPHPVYPNRSAAGADDSIVTPAQWTVQLTLRPGQVRVVRPAGGDRISEVTTPKRGAARADAGDIVVTEPGYIREGTLIIAGNSVWRCDRTIAEGPTRLARDQGQSYAAFGSGPHGRAMTIHHRRLLGYWRRKYLRAGGIYLLAPAEVGEGRTQLDVVELTGPAPTTRAESAATTAPAASRRTARGLRTEPRTPLWAARIRP